MGRERGGVGAVCGGASLVGVVGGGWKGGYVGRWLADGRAALIGGATLGLPAVLVIVGALMVARSDLVDVRPFRTGLVVLALTVLLGLLGFWLGSAL